MSDFQLDSPKSNLAATSEQRSRAVALTTGIGAVLNLLLAGSKILIGSYSQSQGLVADGVHSLSDLASDLLVWIAGRHAAQGPDADHPYGHARYETVATLVLGMLLFAVAIGIGWDAVNRLFNVSKLLQPGPAALLAGILSVVIKEWLYWWTLGFARRVKSELLRANAWHHRSDAISSVIVIVGILGTMAGLPYLDAIAAVVVSLMIARIAWELAWSAIAELVDTGLESKRLTEIQETIRSVGGVRDIHMLRTRKHGGSAVADVHVLVDPAISVSEGHMISTLVEHRLKKEIDEIRDVTVHIDPEDDESDTPSFGLPLRAEAEAVLASLWSAVPEANERHRCVFHYLRGRIDVDVYFPLVTCTREGADGSRLKRILAEPLRQSNLFGELRVYYG